MSNLSDKPWLVPGHMYQYDIGWLVDKLLSFETELNTAIDLKTIHYADPIQWDITTQYSPNTVVVDPKTGTAYMSKVPVPSGVLLTNTDYWVVIFNYQRVYDKIMSGVAYNDRDNLNASKDLLVNDLVWYGGDLYRATRGIPQGTTYIPGTNLTPTTIADCLATYYGRDRVAQVINDTINVSGDYTLNAGDIAETANNVTIHSTRDMLLDADGNLTEQVTGNLTEQVTGNREIDIDGNDSEHIDGTKTVNVGGYTSEVYGANRDVRTVGMYTQSVNKTLTENVNKKVINSTGDIDVNAQYVNINAEQSINLNKGVTKIQLLSYRKPTVINEYFKAVTAQDVDGNSYELLVRGNNDLQAFPTLQGKKIMIFGDSISDEINNPSYEIHPNWVQTLRTILNGVCTVDNNSLAGRRMIDLFSVTAGIPTLDYDYVIVFVGTNDYGSGVPLGTGYAPGDNSHASEWFAPATRGVLENIRNALNAAGKTDAQIVFITPLWRQDSGSAIFSIDCYTASIISLCNRFNTTFINGTACNPIGELTYSNLMPDKLHPNPKGGAILANYVLSKLLSGCDSVANFSQNRVHALTPAISTGSTWSMNSGVYTINMDGVTIKVNGTINVGAANIDSMAIIDFSTTGNLATSVNVIYGLPYLFSTTDGFIPAHVYLESNKMLLRPDNGALLKANTQYSLNLIASWMPAFMHFPQNI